MPLDHVEKFPQGEGRESPNSEPFCPEPEDADYEVLPEDRPGGAGFQWGNNNNNNAAAPAANDQQNQ